MIICQCRVFPSSYAVKPSFISCFTTFYCLDLYFILNQQFLIYYIVYNYIYITEIIDTEYEPDNGVLVGLVQDDSSLV